MAVWVIREDGDRWWVERGPIRESFTTQEDALLYVRKERRVRDRVILEESDGYRTPLRPRRHWRR